MDANRHKGDLVAWGDVPAALGLLTRLPVRVDTDAAMARGAKAAWAWPLAGLVVALIAGTAGTVAAWLGLIPALTACIVLTAQVILTGAMHEDGLADSADGLWGGWTVERRLAIMKDSRTGAYGVIALVLSLLTRWAALNALIGMGYLWTPLIVAAMFSRVPMVALMVWLAPARGTGLAHSVGRPQPQTLWLATGITVAGGLVTVGAWTLPLLIVTGIVTLGWAAVARAKIGGQTGDILGAVQQLSEIGALLTLISLATHP